jgi:hypothetical protein
MESKPNLWSGIITKNGKVISRVYSKTLKGAKAAASRKLVLKKG